MSGLMRYKAQLTLRMHAAVQSAAMQTAERARSMAPVGDGRNGGHLQDSISHRVQSQGALVAGDVLSDNPHALYVELGTSRMAAQPYLRPAFTGNKARFLQSLST